MVRRPISCWNVNNNMLQKKGTWSPEEDQKLIAYIMRYGIWDWNEMPKYAGLSRSGKSCRLRWMNYLKPDIRRGNFTREEEETIIRLQKMLGNRWSAIAAMLPQRTDNDIKNYWNTRLKKRVENKLSASSSSAELITSSIESEQENCSSLEYDFPEPNSDPYSPSGSSNDGVAAVVDNTNSTYNTMEDNFASSLIYWDWELHGFSSDKEEFQAVSPNSQLYNLHDSYYGTVDDDFWDSPFI
ncbi:hypothetical protein CCACVL1_02430 [Corchorus capsularis]|uniref:Uncharacterized protein n=1 Tax=Corchorus capsularis TaxID=210143 RepID=A0A1R3K8J2_COCAP|nr:hypothetical protein CCACVL1_02430 [Corchorus capsularis]